MTEAEDLIKKSYSLKKQIDTTAMIKNIAAVGYYGLDWVFDGDINELKQYLLTRSLHRIEWGQYTVLVDKEALAEKVNLNCGGCTKKNEFGCCCGSPCHMSRGNAATYGRYKEQINKRFSEIDPVRYEELLSLYQINTDEADYTKLNLVDEDGFVGECNGRCQLLVRQDGMARCLTHLFALEQGIPAYEISPLSCLMFPLELLVFYTQAEEYILYITSTVDNEFSKKFGRWGGYRQHHLAFQCVDPMSHDHLFRAEEYKSLYEVSKPLLCYEFGEQLYEEIRKIYDNNKN